MRIILASESPFRKRAMDLLGVPYEICPSHIDEKAIRNEDPAGLTLQLAEIKARTIAAQNSDAIIVAGDAVAAKNGTIFEKPRDLDEAAQFLRELSGSTFRFITSIVALHSTSGRMLSTVEQSEITFRPLLDSEIAGYIRKYDVLGFAGAFESDAVQMFAERYCGSFNIGTALPVSRLVVFLRELGAGI